MTRSEDVTPATAELPRPALVRAAVWCYLAVAIVNLAVGVYLVSFVPSIAAASLQAGKPVPAEAITLAVVSIAGATIVFSGVMVFFALRLRAGSTWARPVLLTVSILSLAALLIGGGPGLIVILLCIVSAIVVTRAPVTAWLRRARGLPPG